MRDKFIQHQEQIIAGAITNLIYMWANHFPFLKDFQMRSKMHHHPYQKRLQNGLMRKKCVKLIILGKLYIFFYSQVRQPQKVKQNRFEKILTDISTHSSVWVNHLISLQGWPAHSLHYRLQFFIIQNINQQKHYNAQHPHIRPGLIAWTGSVLQWCL